MQDNKPFGLITVLLQVYPNFNQQKSTLPQIAKEGHLYKLVPFLTPRALAAPGKATGKKSWILPEITTASVSSEGGI